MKKIFLLFLLAAVAAVAQPELKTQSWANNDNAFMDFANVLEANTYRNLAAREMAKISSPNHDANTLRFLADGDAGVRGGEGRVYIEGKPTIIRVYLGKVTPIHAAGLYTFNIDARANQDYEIRFADNSAHPGQLPEFPQAPHLTTGEKVIGPNAGGFRSTFENKDGSPIFPKADWVEYRIWRTYNVLVGSPAKAKNTAESWTAAIEIEIFGTPQDVVAPPPEILARRELLKKIPKEPSFEKKETISDTMLANRQNILAWEKQLDDILLPEHGAVLKAWEFAGPYAADSTEAKADAAPQNAKWQPLPSLEDGVATDLAAILTAKPNDVIFLRRPVSISRNFNSGYPLLVRIAFAKGHAQLGNAFRVNADPTFRLLDWQPNGQKGDTNFFVKLQTAADGKCLFYFQPAAIGKSRQTAGAPNHRIDRRRALFNRLRNDFTDPVDRLILDWEQYDRVWVDYQELAMAGIRWLLHEWTPGIEPLWVARQYRKASLKRIKELRSDLPLQEDDVRQQTAAILDRFEKECQPLDEGLNFAKDQARYHDIMALTEAVATLHSIESTRLAVQDQIDTFPEKYAVKGAGFLTTVADQKKIAKDIWQRVADNGHAALREIRLFHLEWDKIAQGILLQNPVLDFEKLIMVRGGYWFASNWSGANHLGNEFVTLSPVKPDGEITPLFKPGNITDYDLDWDAKKLIFGNGRHIMEANIDGSNLRQVTTVNNQHVMHFDGCYLPSGQIIFTSTACEQAVPCTGQWYVANLHIADADGKNERRLCYDQDHDWNPTVLNNGRVIFTRWEYTDTPHYFSRLLFHMNPDGTGQMEYYGSNSYWPNSMFWPRAIPGHTSAVTCVVSGHHGTARQGELIILDPAKGRHEADGVVQRIPGRGKKVKPVIVDNLVDKSWPKFAAPYPLAEPETNRGAGKYFLATMRPNPYAPAGIYLVDIYDNLIPIVIGNYIDARPLRPRFKPPVITPKINLKQQKGFVYMSDVTQGPGLKGYPQGVVKKLRIGAHHYRFGGNGDTYATGYDGGWDCKQIIGTVPVEADGSAFFEIPSNTPIFVQPLDEHGKALQTMRSWFVAMPGETVSCVGCHEPQNTVSPSRANAAAKKAPRKLEPWYGDARGFGFDQEVQPVLDRKCVGCHAGQPSEKTSRTLPDFRRKPADYRGNYSPAYNNLHPYVRRAGIEADYNMQKPGEWDADSSPLIQLLKKGHHGVELTEEEWSRLYTWIDFNVPYAPNWMQSHHKPSQEQINRRNQFKKLHAFIDDTNENIIPMPPQQEFVKPEHKTKTAANTPQLDGWPLSETVAKQQQAALKETELRFKLDDQTDIVFVAIPAGKAVVGDSKGAADERDAHVVSIDKPFWLGKFEITNQQYKLFKPDHDSAFMDARWKDRITRGEPVNRPQQPVIRISWNDAQAFCQWLSAKIGRKCTLPTEDEWEYACRAGTDTPWNFGTLDALQNGVRLANFNDNRLNRWNWGRCHKEYDDGAPYSWEVGAYPANRWGLHDMHGNVAEWTASSYTANSSDLKVVRGGSWNDMLPQVRSASRWRYPQWQPVYNVGFRVKID